MRREFVPFDPETIAKELDSLPAADANKLTALVTHYEKCGVGNPSPAKIDDYGDGIYRLRHIKPAYKGRMIFFSAERVGEIEKLVILVVYKKEGGKMPLSVLETARRRRANWIARKKRNDMD